MNWNGRKFLEQFLPDVVQFSHLHAEVVVADNGSTDSSVDYLTEKFPKIRIIRNGENLGFAAGYNRSLQQVDTDYYIILNNDIRVTEHWIEPVIGLMESDPAIAACQPKILSFHDPALFEYAGAAGGFIDKFGYPFCRGRIFQSIEEDTGQYDQPAEVFWATGACLFVKAKLYHLLGGFDEDFFAHMEEIDLCWRLKNQGFKVMYCPGSVVYHVGGGSLPKDSALKTYLNIRNNIVMLFKNLPGEKLITVHFIRFFMDLAAAGKFLVDGGLNDFLAVFRAYGSFYRKIGRHRLKRKQTTRNATTMIYRSSIVVDHYIRRKTRFSELSGKQFR